VDDIIANIRKSVETELDSLTVGSTRPKRGSMMRSTTMGMRNAPAPQASSARQDIMDLRSRIQRKVEAMELDQFATSPRVVERAASPAVTHRTDFAGILSGRVQHEPVLRPSLAEDHGNDDLNYAQPYNGFSDEAYAPQEHEAQYHEEHLPTPLMSPDTEAQTQSAFRALNETMQARATVDQTFEHMTRELLHGMLQQWLDANLPSMVEEIVREEIQRVARRGS
jgi:cell pole-organizing protein PopZ